MSCRSIRWEKALSSGPFVRLVLVKNSWEGGKVQTEVLPASLSSIEARTTINDVADEASIHCCPQIKCVPDSINPSAL